MPPSVAFGEGDFIEAPELLRLANDLVRHWPELAFLSEFQGRVLWKRKGGEKGGKATFAKFQVLSGMLEFFSGADWVMWVAADHTRVGEFDAFEEMVYHELLHAEMVLDEEGESLDPPQIRARGHDYEGFLQEIRRYGAWAPDLRSAKAAFEQPLLPGFSGRTEGPALPGSRATEEMPLRARPGYIREGADADFKEVVATTFEAAGYDVDRGTGEIRRPDDVTRPCGGCGHGWDYHDEADGLGRECGSLELAGECPCRAFVEPSGAVVPVEEGATGDEEAGEDWLRSER